MSNQLKVGDVVKLNSGSIHMTVSYINSEGMVEVTWFNSLTNTLEFKGSMNPETFKKLNP